MKNFGEPCAKTKLQPENSRVAWVLLIFQRFLSAYDRMGTIVGLNLRSCLLGDGWFCPTFCFQAVATKKPNKKQQQYTQTNLRKTTHPANKHRAVSSRKKKSGLYLDYGSGVQVCGTNFPCPVIEMTVFLIAYTLRHLKGVYREDSVREYHILFYTWPSSILFILSICDDIACNLLIQFTLWPLVSLINTHYCFSCEAIVIRRHLKTEQSGGLWDVEASS